MSSAVPELDQTILGVSCIHSSFEGAQVSGNRSSSKRELQLALSAIQLTLAMPRQQAEPPLLKGKVLLQFSSSAFRLGVQT